MLVNLLEQLEKFEKEQGMLGTIIGVLLLAVITLFALTMIILISKWWISASTWVIEFFIGVKIL
ncbi:Uncharacterised protein [[Clostridium] sordellii]|jgi:hypothetical protein|uniref:hypothetical protein n=1 Tax=Paraclostridium sordellii TaxID=1505 RepID=UPI0005E1B109|nr:hypothetical protein [Paeniclostridium sordellii]CEN25238.1 Uncharacterised protein [[Clostridium] sordellii] [Paeniclostridium sordellii]